METEQAVEEQESEIQSIDRVEKVDLEELPWDEENIRMTWAVHEIDGLLKDWNPAYIQRMLENAKAKAMREQRSSDPVKWVFIVIMFMTGAAIAYQIYSSGGGTAVSNAAGSVGGTSVSLLMAKIRGGNN